MTGFGSIEGLSAGWMAAGAGAMALTVALHLWKRRASRVYFPPAILFAKHEASMRRGRRLDDALMLLLRLLTVASLALAFDRPTLSIRDSQADDLDGHDVVILLDRSASMQRIEAGRSLFDRARDQAVRLIRSFDGKPDHVGVVVVDADPEPVLPELTHNLAALSAQVQNIAPTGDRGDVAAALVAADSLFSASDGDGHARSIIALTDLQKSQWADALDVEIGASVEFRDMTRSDRAANNAVLSLSAEPGPLRAGQTARLHVRIARFADTAGSVDVQIETPMGRAAQHVQAPARGQAVAQFTVQPAEPGEFHVRATINADALESDNALESAIPVMKPQRVALLSRHAHDPDGSAMYLAAATQAVMGRPLVVLTPDEMTRASLDPFDIVIIASAGSLDADILAALRAAAEHGAGLIWMIDSDDAIESLGRGADEDWAPSIPASDHMKLRDKLTLDLDGLEPFLSGASGGAYDGVVELFHNVVFNTVSSVQLRGSAEALLSFSDAAPFVAATTLGRGRVITVHANLSPSHSEFAANAVFPVFVSALLDHASPTDAVALAQRDPSESDLDKLESRDVVVSDGQSPQLAGRDGDKSSLELWLGLIGAALSLVMVDVLLGAGLIGRSHARPAEVSL